MPAARTVLDAVPKGRDFTDRGCDPALLRHSVVSQVA
jgi:hypothetical protein